MSHPRYSGPLIDVHSHADRQHFHLLEAAVESNGVDKIINLWNLEWPPPSFDDWGREFAGLPHDRMLLHHVPDMSRTDRPDLAQTLADETTEAADRGASGVKVWKNLGLSIKDENGDLLAVDDTRLDPLWQAAGEAGLPVFIHVADPVAFFEPLDGNNERYEELSEHPDWWFGGPEFPSFHELMEQFENIVARHPETTFVGVHVGCYAENLGFVGRMLDAYPNYHVDTSGRIGELGRHGAERVHDFFVRYADRILFGSDLARTASLWFPEKGYYDDHAMRDFYDLHWRYFETDERGLQNPFPLQGDWTVDGIELPQEVLEKIYHINALRVVPALR